jgi:uncharacterized protein (DUF427 family)
MFNKFWTFLFFVPLSVTLLVAFFPSEMPPKPRLNVQNFPRPPTIERTNRHLQIKWQGQTIADTKDAYWILETYHPPSKFLFHFRVLL